MTHVRAELNQSERRVCRVLGQARSTPRYTAVACAVPGPSPHVFDFAMLLTACNLKRGLSLG